MSQLSILQISPSWVTAMIIFILSIAFYLAGHKTRIRRNRKYSDLADTDTGKISGILIGLLGFLLAFTFGMANSRFDHRRTLIVEEANDIGTAFLRTKTLPDSMQKILTPAFNQYLEARIEFSTGEVDYQRLLRDYNEADSIGKAIWNICVNYTSERDAMIRINTLIPALNDMIDITTSRRAAGEATIPDSILYFLFVLCFCSAFILGYESKGRIDWVVLSTYSIMISITVFTILDLDKPRSGFITMDVAVQKMIDLRGTFY